MYMYTYIRGTGRPSEEEIGSMLRCAHELRDEAQASLDSRGQKRYGKFTQGKGAASSSPPPPR